MRKSYSLFISNSWRVYKSCRSFIKISPMYKTVCFKPSKKISMQSKGNRLLKKMPNTRISAITFILPMVRCLFQDVSFPLGLIAADMVEITSMVQSIVNRLRTFILQK